MRAWVILAEMVQFALDQDKGDKNNDEREEEKQIDEGKVLLTIKQEMRERSPLRVLAVAAYAIHTMELIYELDLLVK